MQRPVKQIPTESKTGRKISKSLKKKKKGRKRKGGARKNLDWG